MRLDKKSIKGELCVRRRSSKEKIFKAREEKNCYKLFLVNPFLPFFHSHIRAKRARRSTKL
jgi:hypothetical protein